MLGQSISKNSLILGAFALVTASVLAVTHQSTKERIAAAERAAAQRALFEVVPEDRHDNDMLDSTQPIPQEWWSQLGLRDGGDMNFARKDGETTAVIMPAVAPDGYSGDIRMIVGINRDGSIAGVRVLSHTETPGLGDKIDLSKSDWILTFNGKSLENPTPEDWAVKKDGGEFDQFTGATITPRAVVRQVKKALVVFEQNRERLLQADFAEAESDESTTAPVRHAPEPADDILDTELPPDQGATHE